MVFAGEKVWLDADESETGAARSLQVEIDTRNDSR